MSQLMKYSQLLRACVDSGNQALLKEPGYEARYGLSFFLFFPVMNLVFSSFCLEFSFRVGVLGLGF